MMIVDSLLCYIQSIRSQRNYEDITKSVVAFYSAELIRKSKEELFSLLKTKLIRRKACESHPNPSDADVNTTSLTYSIVQKQIMLNFLSLSLGVLMLCHRRICIILLIFFVPCETKFMLFPKQHSFIGPILVQCCNIGTLLGHWATTFVQCWTNN